MEIRILQNPAEAGELAAKKTAAILCEAVEKNGSARLMAATGQSQFALYDALLKLEIPWEKIEIFHLDEYVGLPKAHPASFQKYIKERFVDFIHPKAVYYIDGLADMAEFVPKLNKIAAQAPMDVGMIGFGVNAHIAFNDPPANFQQKDPFTIVELKETCKQQQVGEGWFPTTADVPARAVSASVPFIQSFRNIVSLIPHRVKADAVKKVLEAKTVTPDIPGTALLSHPNWFLYLEPASACLLDLNQVSAFDAVR